MPCNAGTIGGSAVILCTPTYEDVMLKRQPCFDKKCKGSRWHVVAYEGWYGATRCCLRCGRVSSNYGDGWANRDLSHGRGVATRERERNKARWRRIWRQHLKITGGEAGRCIAPVGRLKGKR